MHESAEWKKFEKFRHLSLSLELYQRNHHELTVTIESFLAAELPILIDRSERWRRRWIQKELVFLLHNYLASSSSLVDHSRRLWQSPDVAVRLPSIEEEISSRFHEHSETQLLHGLRNFSLHYKLPDVILKTDFNLRQSSVAVRLCLNRRDLNQWDGWKRICREYLSRNEELEIRPIIAASHDTVMDFYGWLSQQVQEAFAPEIENIHRLEQHEMERRIAALSSEINEIERSNRPAPDPRDLLLDLLAEKDQIELMVHEDSQGSWLAKALSKIQQRTKLPTGLELRIKKLYSSKVDEVSDPALGDG